MIINILTRVNFGCFFCIRAYPFVWVWSVFVCVASYSGLAICLVNILLQNINKSSLRFCHFVSWVFVMWMLFTDRWPPIFSHQRKALIVVGVSVGVGVLGRWSVADYSVRRSYTYLYTLCQEWLLVHRLVRDGCVGPGIVRISIAFHSRIGLYGYALWSSFLLDRLVGLSYCIV